MSAVEQQKLNVEYRIALREKAPGITGLMLRELHAKWDTHGVTFDGYRVEGASGALVLVCVGHKIVSGAAEAGVAQ